MPVCAQSLPYTQKLYNYKLYSDIPYGTATDYAGESVELKLDIYKPLNDQNCRRPIFIMVHGGSFIGGHKAEGTIPAVCAEMAQRGYVVASINYRLGTHKAASYQPYALCGNGTALDVLPGAKCAYSADSLEFIRGYYRGVQDAKGAVRYMKSRAAMDSTDVNNVYIGGESAGGFIALGVGYMDIESEKPAAAYALAAAPTPDTDLLSCLPSSYDLSRPDLGSVEGMLNTTNPNINSRVQGVANFTGGVIWNLYEGNSKPPVYLYHLTADPVVPCNYNKAYAGFSAAINSINLCQPINGLLPHVYGSCAIADYFESLGTAAPIFIMIL
ncbi:MAG: alpha/beta hydrolase [Sphingobacteriales bacterium]|nr:alpha/beta hydrolase [Sphingobacteriales bacterium]